MHETILEHEETPAMSIRKRMAFLKVKGVGLEENLCLIGKISDAPRLTAITIFGLLTITSSILLFVDWNGKERALSLVRNTLRDD